MSLSQGGDDKTLWVQRGRIVATCGVAVAAALGALLWMRGMRPGTAVPIAGALAVISVMVGWRLGKFGAATVRPMIIAGVILAICLVVVLTLWK